MEQAVKENSITQGVIWKQLLIFFFPILIGTFFQQLYNTVDTIVVGQYVGTNALAAVGTTGTLINLLVGFFVGVSSGATVIISQFFGAGDGKNVSKAVHTSIALALAGGLIIMVLGLLTARPSLVLLGVPEEILGDALTYMNVYYCGIIASMIYNVGTGVLRAIGDSRMPLYVLIVCCLVNIVLDLLFVLGFHWDVFGVAIATVLSQVVSAVLIMARLMLTRESYRVELKRIRFDKSILKNVIRIGLQPDDELCTPGNILAGPFHPAMGELVKSRVLRTEVTSKLEKLADCGAITIYCPARLESKLRGQKSCNLRYWEEYFPGLALQIIQDKADEIRVCPHVNPSHR